MLQNSESSFPAVSSAPGKLCETLEGQQIAEDRPRRGHRKSLSGSGAKLEALISEGELDGGAFDYERDIFRHIWTCWLRLLRKSRLRHVSAEGAKLVAVNRSELYGLRFLATVCQVGAALQA